jgi:predicted site-specific integrase-resolvase
MPVTVSGQTYYRTNEVCQMAGLGRSTLLRWFRSGVIKNRIKRDRRGWRLFSKDDVEIIETVANHIQ